ncbi:MAG: outer membrane beta-barrel protein [Prolixibacteraceae bacterium]|jgi:opacity protein-like surface antigen|nr:porin family protein [Prolixibacteraceae bacterium]
MKIKRYIGLVVILLATMSVKAQEIYVDQTPSQEEKTIEHLFMLNYNMGFSTGEIKDFTKTSSFRGTSFEYRYLLKPQFSIGFSMDYQNFYDAKGNETMDYNDITLTGNTFNWVYTSSVMATTHYYLTNPAESILTPYMGIGIGGVYTNYEKTLGGIDFRGDSWQFGLAPEVGVLVKINDHLSFNAAARYNFTFENNEMNSQKYWSIKTGIAFRF